MSDASHQIQHIEEIVIIGAEIEELKEKIKALEKRVSRLEKKNRQHKDIKA